MGKTGANIDNFFALFKKDDEQAFSFFYRLYYNDLYSYGISLGEDVERLRDIIQDIFYKIHLNKHKFSSPGHLKFYLLKSLRNAIYDRKRKAGSSSLENHAETSLSFSITTTVLDDMIEEEDRSGIQKKVDGMLALLTDRQREAIFLRYMKELEYAEIADILDLTPHGARKLVSRAISRLKESGETQNIPISLLFLYLLFK